MSAPEKSERSPAGPFQSWAREQVGIAGSVPHRGGALRPALPYAFDATPQRDEGVELEVSEASTPDEAPPLALTAVALTPAESTPGAREDNLLAPSKSESKAPGPQTGPASPLPASTHAQHALPSPPSRPESRESTAERAAVTVRRGGSPQPPSLPRSPSEGVRSALAALPASPDSRRTSGDSAARTLRPRLATAATSAFPVPVAPPAEPTIEIHIGRIEVRAAAPARSAAPAAPSPAQPQDRRLENYLRRRGQGARS
jgi:hypothetical protein